MDISFYSGHLWLYSVQSQTHFILLLCRIKKRRVMLSFRRAQTTLPLTKYHDIMRLWDSAELCVVCAVLAGQMNKFQMLRC